MNSKTKGVWAFAMAAVLGLAGYASAAKIINIVGTWSGTNDYIHWYGGTSFNVESEEDSLVVTNQYGALFQGTLAGNPMTGVISGKNIAMTAYGWGGFIFIDAKVTGKKIAGTWKYFNNGPQVITGIFVYTKE